MVKFIREIGMVFPTESSTQKKRYGLYECPSCNSRFEAEIYKVNKRKQKTCINCRKPALTHGMRDTKIYRVWGSMKQRCFNGKSTAYTYYGGRGIKVCDEWLTFEGFYSWAKDKYKDGLSIDRIDVDCDYEPNNCRFVTDEVQARNTRLLRKTNKTGYRGVALYRDGIRFTAQIKVNGKKKHLGIFNTKKEGAIAYNNYIIENGLEHTLNIV